MRVLVTGGSGFLGSVFSRRAASAGHEVGILSRRAPGSPDGRVRWLTGSLAVPPWADLERFAPEVCIHAAWITTPGVYLEGQENDDWVRWSEGFLNRLAELGCGHIVALGTCIEYQITGRALVEDLTPLVPACRYARAKCALRERLAASLPPRGASLAWTRIFYPYGEGEAPARLVSSLVTKLCTGGSMTLRTPHSLKDYIHVDDVAAALLAVVERRFTGAVNVGTGVGVSVEAIAREVARLLGRADRIIVPSNPPLDPLDYVVADAARLRSLGWQPGVSLEAGLRRLVESQRR